MFCFINIKFCKSAKLLIVAVSFLVFNQSIFFTRDLVAQENQTAVVSEDDALIGFLNNFYLFAQSQGLQIDIPKSRGLLKEVSSFVEFNKKDVEKILQTGKSQELFLNVFEIKPSDLSVEMLPLFVFLKNEGYVLVINISEEGIKYINLERYVRILPQKEFFNDWNRFVISLPIVNKMVKRADFDCDFEKKGKFIVIYIYHNDEFSKIEFILDKIVDEAYVGNKKLIYIDELGLIPEESIKFTEEKYGLSNKESFLKVKNQLETELVKLSKGIRIRDYTYQFYDDLYAYLAKHKIKSIMEDLDYELWSSIVAFDKNMFYDKAINAFIKWNKEDILASMTQFIYGFWSYNVALRDKNFKIQIENLMKDNSDAVIFTIRGPGHYGMEEKLKDSNFDIETLFIGEETFRDNFVTQQLIRVYDSNNVYLTDERRSLYILQSIPQEMLRQYFKSQGENLMSATRISKQIVDNMGFSDFETLALILRNMLDGKELNPSVLIQSLGETVYNWAKSYGFVKDN